AWFPTQAPRQLVAVQAGQPDIQNSDVGQNLERLRKPLAAVVDDMNVVPQIVQQYRERIGGVAVVLDEQYALGRTGMRVRLGFGVPRHTPHAGGRERQAHGKIRALVGSAARDADAAAVQLRDSLDQREPDAETAFGAGERALALDE